jgi:hypothetical protein
MAVLLLILLQLLLHLPLQHVPVTELQHFAVGLPRVTCIHIDGRSPCRAAVHAGVPQGRQAAAAGCSSMLRRVEGGRHRELRDQMRDLVQLPMC